MTRIAKVTQPWAAVLASVMLRLRSLKKISMREHARELGVSPSTLHRIEHGEGCDVSMLLQLHRATGIAYEALLEEKRPWSSARLAGKHK